MGWNETEIEGKLQNEIGMSKQEAVFVVKQRKTDIKDKERKKKIEGILDMLKETTEEGN